MLPIPDIVAWLVSCVLLLFGLFIVVGDRLIGVRIKQRMIEADPGIDVVPPIVLVGGLHLAVGVVVYPADIGAWRWFFVGLAFFVDTSWWLGLLVGLFWMSVLEKPEPHWVGLLIRPIGDRKRRGERTDTDQEDA